MTQEELESIINEVVAISKTLDNDYKNSDKIDKILADNKLKVVFDLNNVQVNVSGDGLWSSASKPVTLTNIKVDGGYCNDITIFFDKNSWSVIEDGLIYTDSGFEKEFNELLLTQLGIPELLELDYFPINYTEQGMQGESHISMQVTNEVLTKLYEKSQFCVK